MNLARVAAARNTNDVAESSSKVAPADVSAVAPPRQSLVVRHQEVVTPRPKSLFRYSESIYANRALKFGEFRLRPAADYLALEGDLARQDDERKLSWQSPPGAYKATIVETEQPLKIIGPVTWTEEVTSNYYVICFSMRFHEVLFDEFAGSDACLVIRDTGEFCERIHEATSLLLPHWTGHDQRVTYAKPGKLGVSFAKPSRFSHQAEYRFSWLPPKPQTTLDPLTIHIGSIESIAHIEPSPKRVGAYTPAL